MEEPQEESQEESQNGAGDPNQPTVRRAAMYKTGWQGHNTESSERHKVGGEADDAPTAGDAAQKGG